MSQVVESEPPSGPIVCHRVGLRSLGGNDPRRVLLAASLLLSIQLLGGASAKAQRIIPLPGTAQVGQFQKAEFAIEWSPGSGAQPDQAQSAIDRSVGFHVDIQTPRGEHRELPAFWYEPYVRRVLGEKGHERLWLYPSGPAEWRVRFAPEALGVYLLTIPSEGRDVPSSAVKFECVPSANPGFLQASRKDPRFLERSRGTAFFPIGQNLAFIGTGQYVALPKAEQILSELSRNGANYVRVWACAEDWALAIEARKSAWTRSWDWHLPLVALPGSHDSNRLCLWFSAKDGPHAVRPTHEVALRPNTSYTLDGKIRGEAGAKLALQLRGTRSEFVPNGTDWTVFHHTFTTGAEDWWLGEMSLRVIGDGTVWLDGLSLRETGGGLDLLWEADVKRAARGVYDPIDSYLFDELLGHAEEQGILFQVCLLTRDLYMPALKNPASPAYDQAIADAKKLFEYAVARWGYSTSVGAWEYWNEMDPKLPTGRFYTELGQYLQQVDLYKHVRTTSTWGPSATDCANPALDVADVHFYLRPTDRNRLSDEVEAISERSEWLRSHAPDRPAHLGEFGLADDQWRITPEMRSSPQLADVHNLLWASALSGLAGTALPWWWERIDQRGGYAIYRPLSAFIADVPWTGGAIERLRVSVSDPQVRVAGLRSGDRAWLWVFHHDASWANIVLKGQVPVRHDSVQLRLPQGPAGPCRVQWWDTRAGKLLQEERLPAGLAGRELTVPPFVRDVAGKIMWGP